MRSMPIQIWGSLQPHRAVDSVDGGVCPCIGTTDFGLPRVLELEYEEVSAD